MLAEFTFWDAVGTMVGLLFVLMFLTLFIFLFIDVFGREDLSGWGKAGWVLLLMVLPLIGSLIYIVARSEGKRHERVRSMPQPGGG
jgi:hypothetical protein